MSTARDELATYINDVLLNKAWEESGEEVVDKVIANGWIKPRTITTVEELEALHMVVIRYDTGIIANIVNGKAYCFGYEQSAPVSAIALPATVLWEPKP